MEPGFAGGEVATLPLDGFVSLDAGPNPGTLTTRTLVFQGGRLLVNFEDSQKPDALVKLPMSLNSCFGVMLQWTRQPRPDVSSRSLSSWPTTLRLTVHFCEHGSRG